MIFINNEKKADGFMRRIVSVSTFCSAALSLMIFMDQPAAAQTNYYLKDYHFRAGDGGMAASTLDEGIGKQWNNGYSLYWYPSIVSTDNISATYRPGL